MLRLAVRNLLQNRTRLLISVGGVGLSLTLVLFFGAIFAGAQSRLTVYIDNTGADVWVSQQGVKTMHMSQSTLPAYVLDDVSAVSGVSDAVPILFAEAMIQSQDGEYIAYVFGVKPDAPLGRPWNIVDGTDSLGPDEVIIDRAIAAKAGLQVGDQVTVLGRQMTIVGLTSGTSTLVSSVSFVRFEDFTLARGGADVISFVLARVSPGASPEDVANSISEQVPNVTVQTSSEFADEERELVGDMSSDIINIMNTAGLLTGFAVLVLTIYIATVARRREYGVLKAMGVRNSRLYLAVLIQALCVAALGLLAALATTLTLSFVIPRFNELMVLSVTLNSLVRVTVIAGVLAAVAALLPARQIAGLEPVAVLRKG